jgi:hypothetical protein
MRTGLKQGLGLPVLALEQLFGTYIRSKDEKLIFINFFKNSFRMFYNFGKPSS